MKIVNIHDAKTHLSRLLVDVEQGEEVRIARAGKPIARLTAIPRADQKRRLGALAGRYQIPDDFDRWAEDEIADAFEGNA